MFPSFVRWLTALVTGVLALGLAGPVWAADDKPAAGATAVAKPVPPDAAGLDKKINDVLKDIHNRGADLYNLRDYAGCYRLFQGALQTVQPLLDHHPDLQKEITKGLADADSKPQISGRAWALHELIDKVRSRIKPAEAKTSTKKPTEAKPGGQTSAEKKPGEKKPDGNKPAGSLWSRLGGEDNIKKVVDDFVALAAKDPKVDFTRGNKYKLDEEGLILLKKELIDFISAHAGGPYPYSGKTMKEAHQGMVITDAQFDALVADLKKALEKNGAKPADVQAVLGVVQSTRKDIVEKKKAEKKKPPPKPDKTKPGAKKPGAAK